MQQIFTASWVCVCAYEITMTIPLLWVKENVGTHACQRWLCYFSQDNLLLSVQMDMFIVEEAAKGETKEDTIIKIKCQRWWKKVKLDKAYQTDLSFGHPTSISLGAATNWGFHLYLYLYPWPDSFTLSPTPQNNPASMCQRYKISGNNGIVGHDGTVLSYRYSSRGCLGSLDARWGQGKYLS